MALLDRVRQKSPHERQLYAVAGAGIITAIIGIVWLSTMSPFGVQPAGPQQASVEQAEQTVRDSGTKENSSSMTASIGSVFAAMAEGAGNMAKAITNHDWQFPSLLEENIHFERK